MFNNFYHSIIRKYIINFGRMFNDISIVRYDKDQNPVQSIKIPIAYGPKEKFLVRLRDDPKLDKQVAIKLPRLSFEMTGLNYAPERGLAKVIKNRYDMLNRDNKKLQFTPTPYDFNISLYGMFENNEDAVQVVEQILPYFRPEWTFNMRLVDSIDEYFDIPYILNQTTIEDTYESNFDIRRAIIYTFTFTIKGYLLGPIQNRGVIKRSVVDVVTPPPGIQMGTFEYGPQKKVILTPGLTANGEPTTNPDESIPYMEVQEADPWDYAFDSEEYLDGIERHDH